jgi:hypothetical protein
MANERAPRASARQPDKFRIDVTSLPEAARAMMASNRQALLAYAGTSMSDNTC